MSDSTPFGFRDVDPADKAGMVRGVFESVASGYDLMNDLMSAGVHRLWKSVLIDLLAPRNGEHFIDVAGGTGDIAFRILARLKQSADASVTVCDLTPAMLETGRARAIDRGLLRGIDWIAGKTGTPPYGNDRLTLKEIRQKCRAAPPGNAGFGEQQEWWTACSREVPYKWYVALFKTDDGQNGFNKAIAVLTERNWYRSGPQAGKVQSPGDHDQLNISAEFSRKF